MAIVFVARNIARAFTLARCLRAENPIVFAYDQDVPAMVDNIPALGVPVPHPLTDAARSAIWYEIDTYARRSHPAMVIADTETVDLCEGAGEVRILIVDSEFSKRHPRRYRKYARTCTELVVLDDGEKQSLRDVRQIASGYCPNEPPARDRSRPTRAVASNLHAQHRQLGQSTADPLRRCH
jgi:hypothetical protein